MPIQANEPRVVCRRQAEPGDRPLETDLVGIQELNRYRLAGDDRVNNLGTNPIVWVAAELLPHADVAGRNIKIPRLKADSSNGTWVGLVQRRVRRSPPSPDRPLFRYPRSSG